jgi:hypothetical protein
MTLDELVVPSTERLVEIAHIWRKLGEHTADFFFSDDCPRTDENGFDPDSGIKLVTTRVAITFFLLQPDALKTTSISD